MKYSKLRTKDGHIISSKWISKDKTINRNNYSVAVSICIIILYYNKININIQYFYRLTSLLI